MNILQIRAESINLGADKKIEVIDGEISEDTARDSLEYLKNVYKRGGNPESSLLKVLKFYRGNLENEFQFLLAKTFFENKKLEDSYNAFLKSYDGHRKSSLIKSQLITTLLLSPFWLLLSPFWLLLSPFGGISH